MKGIEVLKRVCLWSLAGFGFVCLVIILIRWYDIPLNHKIQSLFGVQCSSENISDKDDTDTLEEIQELVEFARQSVHEDMMGYPYDPALYCADLVSDYKIAVELMRKYPTTFRVIRYEDLSINPNKEAEEIFKFYGRYFDPKVKKFLETHTTRNLGGAHSTFRDSKSTPFRWNSDLTFEEVDEIQRTCAVAMKHWGYVPAMNATHMREFNPVTNYT